MSAITTKNDICNQALIILGIEEEIRNIDQPTTRWEKRCAMLYDKARRNSLNLMMPSFAITDTPEIINPDTQGKYPVPSDCLRVLKVNGVAGDKIHELNGFIKTDFPVSNYIEIEYLKDIKSTGLFSPEFELVCSHELAIMLAPLTKDNSKINYAQTTLVQKRNEYAGINASKIRIKKRSDMAFKGSGFFYRS